MVECHGPAALVERRLHGRVPRGQEVVAEDEEIAAVDDLEAVAVGPALDREHERGLAEHDEGLAAGALDRQHVGRA